MSDQKKKTVTPAQLKISEELMHKLDIFCPSASWVQITFSPGIPDKYTYSVRVVTESDRDNKFSIVPGSLRITEKKLSKHSKRGVTRSIQSKTGKRS